MVKSSIALATAPASFSTLTGRQRLLAEHAERIARPRAVSASRPVETKVVALRRKDQEAGNAEDTNLAQPTGFFVTPKR
ncbi:MAG: hypothetical protein A2140_02615 [Candidatus Muproteobacteria bacterium RBG_16_62_13]|uniref:Uncharacterized protein n=1 Tax=Candidatus Muproteobacteria bacterium RBG_16_62_13 TaxID=1817756 RepID=A0A1F6T4C3_9PROT|nr:MAG: hypothetical protein A2140_02615 [Candidatus Muproteobacteria bacterium RBG_16_62_13]